MKAVVVYGAGDLRVEERPDPHPGPGEVCVAVEWGGICGSDVSYWRHGSSGTAVLRGPLVLGHEIAGRVAELGSGVTGLQVGQPVTVHPATLVGDGRMPARLAGRTNLYPQIRYLGSAALVPPTDGGFAQRLTVRELQVRALPENVDTRRGALAEPLGVALHAVGRVQVAGRDVLVNGAGPVGCLVIAAAKRAGARTVTAADVSADALPIAAAMGADAVIDVRSAPLPAEADLTFEASGAAGALGAVLHATAPGGTVVQVGNLPGIPTPAALGDLVTREITWIGSFRFVDEITDAVDAMAHGLDVTPVMRHTFDIDQAAAAMRVAADRSCGSGKVMLRIG